MKVEKIPVVDIDILSPLMQDYMLEKPEIRHLFDYSKHLSSFKEIIASKANEHTNRELLVKELTIQYKDLSNTEFVLEKIQSLGNNKTFTVTTAHQLCLFTGPLYFIYKAVSVIKLSQVLKEEYPEYNFVPIFWLGSEDHDFEEINHLHVYGKKIEWESGQNGAVGLMKNTNMKNAINELSKILYGGKENDFITYLKDTFSETHNYGKSFLKFFHFLFGKYGLVVLEQNNKSFKKSFAEILQKELINNLIEKNIQKELNYIERNYKIQANPRSINIFYMIDGLRERIVRKGAQFLVNNTEIIFNEEMLLEELKNFPDRFSPNVVLRPLYQEFILPNLAYIGGGGELAYWLQLKKSFHSQARKMPMLLLRDMAVVIDPKTTENIEIIDLDKKCLFKNNELLISELVYGSSSKELDLKAELDILEKSFKSITSKTSNIDKSLEKHVKAQKKKLENSLKNIEQKMLRAEKKNQAVLVQRIEAVKSQLFPKNKLQERHDNFLPYYKKYDLKFIDLLIENFNPISGEIKLIFEKK